MFFVLPKAPVVPSAHAVVVSPNVEAGLDVVLEAALECTSPSKTLGETRLVAYSREGEMFHPDTQLESVLRKLGINALSDMYALYALKAVLPQCPELGSLFAPGRLVFGYRVAPESMGELAVTAIALAGGPAAESLREMGVTVTDLDGRTI